ncbi:MAG: STAS-like domain-containing protein [Acidobacteriaceae bacterium]
MRPVEVFKHLQRKILVTRGSATALRPEIELSIKADGQVVLDFTGIDAVTPSFVDEILGIIDDARADSSRRELRVIFRHTPTSLTEKFLAIGKRHGAKMSQSGADAWEITNIAPGPA